MVPHQSLANGLIVASQPIVPPPPAMLQQPRVELSETPHLRDRHQEVAPCVAHQPFDLPLVVALARSSETIGEQIVGLQLAEDPGALAGAIPEDARYRQLGVVVEDRTRHSAEELEADAVPCAESFTGFCRIGLHQTSIAVRQVHREEVDLALLTSDHRERFTEVDLRMPWIVAQRHKHLTQPLPPLMHVAPYDRDPARIPVLIAQPLENPFRGVLLLGRLYLIFLQDPVNYPHERIQLGPRRRPAPPIPRWYRERQHLRHRPRVDPEAPRRFPLTDTLHVHRSSNLPV